MRALIEPHVELDPHAAERPEHEYTVRSIYLDTPGLDFYHEKTAGIRNRKKFRIRGYNTVCPTSPVFLEIKRKMGSVVAKQRFTLSYQDLPGFFETGDIERPVTPCRCREEMREQARQFFFHVQVHSLHPVITILYEREAFFSKVDRGLRITLDKNLRFHNDASLASLTRDVECSSAMPHFTIVEIKTDSGLPRWVHMILGELSLAREALSKYTMCIDALTNGGYHLDLIPMRIALNRCTSIATKE